MVKKCAMSMWTQYNSQQLPMDKDCYRVTGCKPCPRMPIVYITHIHLCLSYIDIRLHLKELILKLKWLIWLLYIDGAWAGETSALLIWAFYNKLRDVHQRRAACMSNESTAGAWQKSGEMPDPRKLAEKVTCQLLMFCCSLYLTPKHFLIFYYLSLFPVE